MRKVLLFLIAITVCFLAKAQDIIVKNDGSTVLCRIVEVNATDVVYLKWSDLEGSRYVMDKSQIARINYQEGRQDKIKEQLSNAYAPGIQQTGEGQYNDNALLALDRARNNSKIDIDYQKRAKTLKIVGLTVGPVLIVAGIPIFLIGQDIIGDAGYKSFGTTLGGALCVCAGLATTTACLIYSNKYNQMANNIKSYSVIHRGYDFRAGSSLIVGINIINDDQFKQTVPGLGFQFNF